jgi:hypothetical protein
LPVGLSVVRHTDCQLLTGDIAACGHALRCTSALVLQSA